jgi:putative serine protease PepD
VELIAVNATPLQPGSRFTRAPHRRRPAVSLPQVPFDDVGPDDSEDLRPPPHPDDRLWRHPSELQLQGGEIVVRRSRSRGRVKLWGTLTLAAGVGAALTAGVLLTLDIRDRMGEAEIADEITVSPTLSTPLVSGDGTGSAGETPSGTDAGTTMAQLADRLAPAVVRIEGGPAPGSGFVIRPDGKVMTSAGVVEHATTGRDADGLTVSFGDGEAVAAALVGTDPVTDVAVLDLPGDGYATMVLAENPSLSSGAMAAVISMEDAANPGAVEAAAGALTSSRWSLEREGLPPLNGLMQIAASSDPAARGGPVVDADGRVVGFTTWSSDDWSYATPIDVASKVADDLMSTGSAQHCWLGIEGKNAKGSMEAPDAATAGVVITDVSKGGPAAGVLATGDVIVGLDGDPIPDVSSLTTALLLRRPGDEVDITYHQGKGTALESVPVTLEVRPSAAAEQAAEHDDSAADDSG